MNTRARRRARIDENLISCHRNLFPQAENDSKKRRDSVNKVCQRFNVTNILEPQATSSDKRAQQRSVVLKQFFVNEKHKVIYCGIYKVGITTMRQLLMKMNGYDRRSGKKESDFEKKLLDFTEVEQNYMLNNFYKFMIVRDPFERLVSAYRHKFRNGYGGYPDLGKTIIEKYRYNNTKTVEVGAEDVNFTEFVRFLIDIPPGPVDNHWRPFKDACSPCNVKYDFIGSIDTLERDVTHIMRQIHADETKYHVTQKSGFLTKTKLATARLFKEVPQKYFDQLLAIRKTNFELFGYSLPDQKTLEKHYHA